MCNLVIASEGMLKEYAYSKSIALGGDDGILILSVKINKPSLDNPQATITLACVGEAGQNKAVFQGTDFVEALGMFIKTLEQDFKQKLPEIKAEETVMMAQAEILDPEKLKNKLMLDMMMNLNKKKADNDERGIDSVVSNGGNKSK